MSLFGSWFRRDDRQEPPGAPVEPVPAATSDPAELHALAAATTRSLAGTRGVNVAVYVSPSSSAEIRAAMPAVAILVQAAGSSVPQVRAAGIAGLLQVASSLMVPHDAAREMAAPLLVAAREPDPATRLQALQALAWLLSSRLATGLCAVESRVSCLACLEDPEPRVRNFATWLLISVCHRYAEGGGAEWEAAAELAKRRRLLSRVGPHLGKLLLAFYASPEGFYPAIAPPVLRQVGQQLWDTGGMQAMRDTHAHFAELCPFPGAARNLEILWDGIGGWRG